MMSTTVQTNITHGSIAYVAVVKSGSDQQLQQCLKKLSSDDILDNLQFYTTNVKGSDVLFVSYDGDYDVWSELAQGDWRELSSYLETQEGGSSPWQKCEVLCVLKPQVQTRADHPLWKAAVTGLRKEKEAEYRTLHHHVWQEVIAAMGQRGLARFDIFLTELDDELYLFHRLEYVGENYDADMALLGENSTNQRWWTYTDSCQKPLPEAESNGDIWLEMNAVR